MFGSEILEVAIGLAYIYLILSLGCSAIKEAIARLFDIRASALEKQIKKLVEDKKLKDKIYEHPLVQGITRRTWLDWILSIIPWVKRKGRPSHIDTKVFTEALADVLTDVSKNAGKEIKSNATTEKDIKANSDIEFANHLSKKFKDVKNKVLIAMYDSVKGGVTDAEKTLKSLKEKLGNWFDGSMERLSVWYKQKTRLILFVIAFIFAFAFNVDTVVISKSLYQNKDLRQSIINDAKNTIKEPMNKQETKSKEAAGQTGTIDIQKQIDKALEQARTLEAELTKLGLPIGWRTAKPGEELKDVKDLRKWPGSEGEWLHKILGLLLTSFAVSLGSTFWFDLLRKLIGIRKKSLTITSTEIVNKK